MTASDGAHAAVTDASAAGRASATPSATRIDLALGLLLVVAFNAAYLRPHFVPIHDTFYTFADFQIFYSELFYHGDLARWFPYGTYGLQSDYEQLASFGPLAYLVAAIGATLRVTDALFLFKLSVIGEQMVFVFGVWRLAGLLFASRSTVQLLSIAAAGTTVWYAQHWLDLRMYLLLPLLLSFLFEFVETRRPGRLWLAGLTGVLWAMGCVAYLVPIWVFTIAIIGVIAVRDWPATLRSLASHRRSDLVALGLFVGAAAIYAGFATGALESVLIRAPGRDPLSGRVYPEEFRTYGGNANLVIVANALLFGWPVHLPWGSGADNSVYLGLVPLVGLAVALWKERSRFFFALMAGALALVWLSLGGAFTKLAYHVPGLAYYRHVGLTFGLVKVLLLIASGYGLDRLASQRGVRSVSPLLWVVVAMIGFELIAASPRLFGPKPLEWITEWGVHVLVRLGIYGAALAAVAAFAAPRSTMLAVALALDLALFQLVVFQTRVPHLQDASLLGAAQVRAPEYREQRTDAVVTAESRRAIDLATRPGAKDVYWYVYQFANLDPCHGKWRTDYYLDGVDRLLTLGRESGRSIDALLGCDVPKLRVVPDARIARTLDEARSLLRAATRGGDPRPTVIELASDLEAPPADAAASRGGRASVRRFTLNELEADVAIDGPGGWLVYDDAYHVGWHASVDGREVPVARANLAWKAVHVPSGDHVVRFWFDRGARSVLGTALALLGIAAGIALVGWMIVALLRGDPLR